MSKTNMPGVGLGVIIFNSNNDILLILRNSDKVKADSDMRLEGTWTLPAGKIKYGETLVDAAKRKVKEETNLMIDDLEVISIADDINKYAHFVTIGLIAHKVMGEINLGDTEEHIDYNYFNIEKLPENLCEPSQKIIHNYKIQKIYTLNKRIKGE